MDTKPVYFKGKQSPLSNMFMFSFLYQNILYHSSEQAYQMAKAMFFDNYEAQKCIMDSKDSFESMRIARNMLPKDDSSWLDVRVEIMFSILLEKFRQCTQYRNSLKAGKLFVEDTCHQFWGRGKGNGQNTLGCLHQQVKKNISNILIIGSSHVRDLKKYIGPHHQEPTDITEICRPGSSIEDIITTVKAENLEKYHFIYIITGSNNIFTKKGETLTPTATIIEQLTHLHTYIRTNTLATIKISSILPRFHTNNSHWSRDLFFKYNNNIIYINKKLQHITVPHKQLLTRKRTNTNFFCGDGVHLNNEGKEIVASNLFCM